MSTFEKIALGKKLLPLQFQLMEELIKSNELEKVQKVLDISITVAGEERTLYHAIYSFLCLGKTENVQKLLGTVQMYAL